MVEKEPNKTLCEITIKEVEYKELVPSYTNPLKAFEQQLEDPKSIQTVYKTPKQMINIPAIENSFLATCRMAYSDHQRFILNPADLWQLIAQGFGKHVNLNSKKLRKHFVDFKGKKEIRIYNDMIYGDPENKWETAFPTFSEKIRECIGEDLHNLLISDFSTTTHIEKAASEITLMYTMQKYFSFSNCFDCGFPSIKIEGELEDWEKLITKTQQLEKFDLKWWISKLLPILVNILESIKGAPNLEFWRSFYRMDMSSGGDTLHGWIINFFPYMKDNIKNPYLDDFYDKGKMHWGADASSFTLGLCSVPFKWEFGDDSYDMQLVAGFVGCYQEGEYLRPAMGWAVKDDAKGGKKIRVKEGCLLS